MVTVPLIAVVGLILWFMWRGGYATGGTVLVCIAFGVLLSGTAIGPTIHQMLTSLGHLGKS